MCIRDSLITASVNVTAVITNIVVMTVTYTDDAGGARTATMACTSDAGVTALTIPAATGNYHCSVGQVNTSTTGAITIVATVSGAGSITYSPSGIIQEVN